jgi:hypothetical protein
MSTAETQPRGTDPQVLADLEAVLRHVADKTPMDAELVRRVEERADRATEELRRQNARIDIEQLIRDARDEA